MSWEDLFDNIEARENKEFGMIPAGEYTGFVYEAKLNENKNQVELQWRIIDETSEFKNRHVFGNYKLTEQGIPFLKQDLRIMGFPEVSAKTLPDAITKLVGREALIYVKPREYQGKTYYNVYVNEHLTAEAVKRAYPDQQSTDEIPF